MIDGQTAEARGALLGWLAEERVFYADGKYTPELRAEGRREMEKAGLEAGRYWDVLILNYYSRARLLDPRTPAGRQALGKLIVTLMAAAEAAIVAGGPMPAPGYPSGDLR